MTGTVDALLAEGRALGLDPGAVRALLAHRLDRPPTWLLAHGREPLTPGAFSACREGLARLAEGVPLGQMLGVAEFAGLTLRVTEATLLPRTDTEVLLEGLLRRLPSGPLRILDLGTGSGALALALKAARPELTVFASDISPDALAVAQGNAAHLGLAVTFFASDWYAALPSSLFPLDAIVANPPYIAPGDPELAPSVARFEPALALYATDQGFDALERVLTGARSRLRPGGWLGLEHGHRQAVTLAARLQRAGYDALALERDTGGRPRATFARQPHG
jgi:release factor glutamine methyltransferase